MPTITTHYGITGPVPFVDVEVTADNRLYVDPHAIRLRRTPQPFAASRACARWASIRSVRSPMRVTSTAGPVSLDGTFVPLWRVTAW